MKRFFVLVLAASFVFGLSSVRARMLSAAGPVVSLTISGEEPERILACLPIETDEPFHLEFVNSIYQAPVRETLTCEKSGQIFLIRVESPSAGVFEYYGLEPDGSGQALLHRPVEEIRLRSHDYENHRLSAGKTTLRLKGLVADGEPLIIRVRRGERCGM